MTITIIRLISISIVALAYSQLSTAAFQASFISVLYGHYSLSLYYAKDQCAKLARERSTWIPLAGLALLCAAYLFSGLYVVALVPFIGLHIALSETYMLNQAQSAHTAATPDALWHLNLSRFLTNVALYLLLLHDYPLFTVVPVEILYALVVGAYAYFFWKLPRANDKFNVSMRSSYLSFEVSGLAVAVALHLMHIPLSFQLFVFYHVLTWIIFPAISFHRRGDAPALRRFAVHTVVSTAFFFLLTSPLLLKENAVDLKSVIPLWATLHFVTSFPLSRLNPRFITRFFYPEKST